jgi:hypothetical protein
LIASQDGFSLPITFKSTWSTWEPLDSSKVKSTVTSILPVVRLKTQYACSLGS